MEILKDPKIMGQIMMMAFLAIVFMQSALDKILNWSGNASWIKEHFSKTFLSGMTPLLLGTLTVAELITGLLAIKGLWCGFVCENCSSGYHAVLASLVSYLMLLFGQRIAQDYEGAKTIAIYFGVSMIGLLLFI